MTRRIIVRFAARENPRSAMVRIARSTCRRGDKGATGIRI
jgi:hypothetical protein